MSKENGDRTAALFQTESMMRFLGAILFTLFFVFLAPTTRNAIFSSISGFTQWIIEWSPYSVVVPAAVLAAGVTAIQMVRNAPLHVEPENPMAKYRRDPLMEPEEF